MTHIFNVHTLTFTMAHYSRCQEVTLWTRAQTGIMLYVHSMFQADAILPLIASLLVCYTYNSKDRSDYNKAVLLTLPVQREAEVVVLFHATVQDRLHDFLCAIWCKLHCTTSYFPFASPNDETGLMLRKSLIYESGGGHRIVKYRKSQY